MVEQAANPLAAYIRKRMEETGIGQKQLALRAGLGDTYVRDILKGRSTSPQVVKLTKLAEALGVPVERLLGLTAAREPAEFVEDTAELVLLRAWRQLPDAEREGVLRYINFRLDELTRPQRAREQQ